MTWQILVILPMQAAACTYAGLVCDMDRGQCERCVYIFCTFQVCLVDLRAVHSYTRVCVRVVGIVRAVYCTVVYDRVRLNRPCDTIRSAHIVPSCPVRLYRRIKRYANDLGPTQCLAQTIPPQLCILHTSFNCKPVQAVNLLVSTSSCQ